MSKILVIGATGTLGRQTIKKLLETDGPEIVCFSRDELKQKELQKDFKSHPRLSFVIGDIRDRHSVFTVFRDVSTAFHFAALKHVDTMELNPEESVKTNILGTMNIADAAVANGVSYVVFSSTDKAVEPINTYGMCKAISEKILLRRNQTQKRTRFSVFRWGNVAGSRGSFIPQIAESIRSGKTIGVTDYQMTRFWIRIEDAVDFLLNNFTTASTTDAMIPPIKAAPLTEVIKTVSKLVGNEFFTMDKVPIRPGEKLHESLTTNMRSDQYLQYSANELQELFRDCV